MFQHFEKSFETISKKLPTNARIETSCNDFASFFSKKIMLIRDKISAAQSVLDAPLDSDLPSIHPHLTEQRSTDEKGVNIDQHLSMVQQVTSVCGTCNYHLYRLSSIHQFLTTDATRSAVITSRLDYCNALLAGMPVAQIAQLQRIQNNAARLVSRTPWSSHIAMITPVLKHLHWLPVDSRITYKIAVTVFKCLHDLAPSYLVELLTIHQRNTLQLCQPVAKKSVWQQAFSVTGPRVWNALPTELRHALSLASFRRQIRTFLFTKHYSIWCLLFKDTILIYIIFIQRHRF